MKTKFVPLLLASIFAAVVLIGCMTSKTTTVTPGPDGPVTNTATTVNAANLALDCNVIQGVTAGVTAGVIQKLPGSAQTFKGVQMALDGILNGTNPQTTSQALALIGADGNQVLSDQATLLINAASAL